MKRQAIALAAVAERSNLIDATFKAARGKRGRPVVRRFIDDLERQLDALSADLLDGRAPRGEARSFVIHDPKRRVIHAACFVDRVLHHAIMNCAAARFERWMVDSVHACRTGRGIHSAVGAVQRGLRARPWFVQVDVHSYFASIPHDRLKAMLARMFKGAPFLALLDRIIDASPTGSHAGSALGLPIGSLMSQYFANAYLGGADRLLLARPGCGAHVRYMDDLFWGCDSRFEAERSLACVREYLADECGLTLKPGARIARSGDGLQFCGFRVRQGVVLAGSRKMRRFRQRVSVIEALRQRERVPEWALQRAWDNAASALTGCRSETFRRGVLARYGYSEDSGCAS